MASHIDTRESDVVASESDDYLCALLVQMSLISEDYDAGQLGTQPEDTQFAVECMLQEAMEFEQSRRLARMMCESLPDELLEELTLENMARSDRELAELISQGDPEAEATLEASTTRFELALEYFNSTSECNACGQRTQVYIAPCGHAYCEGCARSLYSHALRDRALIPVRCCKEPFASDMAAACLTDAADISKYDTIRREIEHPCPPAAELDMAASRLITENGWKVCARCGAVVERMSGCVHITCVCRYEFCYTCEKTWRTCRCELYPTEEINQILNERIGNDDPGTNRHRLQNVLRNYYEHDHNWERQAPYGRVCNVCDWPMPLYCMYCAVCMETRCMRCCYNR